MPKIKIFAFFKAIFSCFKFFKIFLIIKFKTRIFVFAESFINFAGKPTFNDFQYK